MGTTLVVALLTDGEAVLGNVGDSRAYHVHDTIEQVTVDQSLVQELVEVGTITEAEDHPQSNVVSQALGTSETVEPEFYRLEIDGTLLPCSDRLSDEVSDQTISELVTDTPDLESVAEQLVQTANDNGGDDNISIALCSV
jgi:protein phosphatase